ncbi:hypothetical protein SERLA73DRAFT_179036 [Serpula lacrymans var. lacrymans S7.3]|uniref:Sugar phosphate transporter domain-containing protein n=2 Tax=Serpula lacrymans var. lacrymans TaxID=341189 RepID=F8PTL5_SERL3|nr:uncharacterized protein SERLADRAFT_463960 [Serpula lacrymans var. lacrymans S7.9]EGO01010.1 hypothetical protein SERLA73DRAFT_179036 [Serpula lacrymans var. lacrymans S7.3]EGO26675.1 hypothetical protein SERLADRAFT_463960 [Serpula lacrymans var. lacrymans S7.9]
MPLQHAAKAQNSKMLVTGTVTFYLVAALAMVMANKWVLKTTAAPLFFLLTQLLIAVILFLISHATGLLQVPLYIDMQLFKGLAPMVGLNVVGLSFSNYTLKYVDASFYQVARGLVLPFTVCTSYFLLQSRPSLRILVSCSIVTLGFFVGVFLDGTPISVIGVSFGVASSAITALHSVVIKKSLDVVKGSALHLSWYTNLLSILVLAPIMVIMGELPSVMELLFTPSTFITAEGELTPLQTFMWGSLITGILGFLMSIASLLSIKVTSPITHMVSSAVRGVAASLLGMWLFHDIITSGRASSIAIILGGSIYYTWVKHMESRTPKSGERDGSKYERVPLDDIESQNDSTKPE